jgi:hypothetical protein
LVKTRHGPDASGALERSLSAQRESPESKDGDSAGAKCASWRGLGRFMRGGGRGNTVNAYEKRKHSLSTTMQRDYKAKAPHYGRYKALRGGDMAPSVVSFEGERKLAPFSHSSRQLQAQRESGKVSRPVV